MVWTNMVVHIVFIICLTTAGILIALQAIKAHRDRKVAEAQKNQYNAIADKLAPKTVKTPNKTYTVEYGKNGEIELK